MTKETPGQAALFAGLDEAVAQLQGLVSSLDNTKLNLIPYQDSWTAAQLYQHVIKVIDGIAKAMQTPSKPAGRHADERVAELKKTFLDFSIKMKSPAMAVPEEEVYQKQDIMDRLTTAVSNFKEVASSQNGTDLVSGLPLGDITKLELLHFVLYHTQRHLHQLQQIVDALNNMQVQAGRHS